MGRIRINAVNLSYDKRFFSFIQDFIQGNQEIRVTLFQKHSLESDSNFRQVRWKIEENKRNIYRTTSKIFPQRTRPNGTYPPYWKIVSSSAFQIDKHWHIAKNCRVNGCRLVSYGFAHDNWMAEFFWPANILNFRGLLNFFSINSECVRPMENTLQANFWLFTLQL